MDDFIQIELSVVKSHIIHGIWYEAKCSPSYHVLF